MYQEIEELQAELRDFRDTRNWDQYHTPKNLAMALSGETGELISHFQWLDVGEEPAEPLEVEKEIADVFIYLVMLADKLDIDLVHAAKEKILINAEKYPVKAVKRAGYL